MVRIIPYRELSATDLSVDAVYEGEPGGQLSGEALSRLLPGVGNQGGFRASGRGKDKKFVVLYTNFMQPNGAEIGYYVMCSNSYTQIHHNDPVSRRSLFSGSTLQPPAPDLSSSKE